MTGPYLLAMEKSLQETFAPHNACFGCGPSNEKGLGLQSYAKDDHIVATFKPEKHHEAFEGVLCGGIIGTLMDCHCNWSAAYYLMKEEGLDHPPCTVTADYAIKLLRPTPTDDVVTLKAKLVSIKGEWAKIEAELICKEKVCATCKGTFVAVKPGHPAYHRW